LENNIPAAGCLFWAYGPDRGDITVLAVEPHPGTRNAVLMSASNLSALPAAKPKSHGKN